MKRAFELLSLVLVSALVFSCGGGRPTSPSGNITSAAAKGFANSYSSQLGKGANAFDADDVKNTYVSAGSRHLGFVLREVLHREAPRDLGCTPTESGDTTDADKDGVKVNAVSTFSNCASTLGTFSGGFTFQDVDDTKKLPLAGFKFAINDFRFDLSVASQSVSITSSGFLNATVTDKTAVVAEEMKMNVSGGGQSAEIGAYLDSTLTADSATNPDTSGSLTFSGFFKLAAGEAGDYVLGISSTDLTYASSCSSGFFKNGSISLIDGSNNTVKATYTNCTAAWTYNGDTLSLTR